MFRNFFFIKLVIIFFYFLLSTANSKDIYLSLKKDKVNVRYGPSFDSPIKFVYKKVNLPIKLIDKKENFRRIIDFKNNSGWIHVSQLKKGKAFILLENQILFTKPTKYSKPILKISKGRLLLVKKCKVKWCKIKTEKYIGWLITNNVWGSIE